VDPETVDQNYAQLQQQAQQTAAQIQTLAGKLQAAAAAGDPNAREWMLDLKEITLGVQQEQGQTSSLDISPSTSRDPVACSSSSSAADSAAPS
jgi:hypothetical protein